MAIWFYTRGPELVDIKVGYRCNNACVHCVVDPVRRRIAEDGESEDLSTTQVEALIDGAAEHGAKAVVLTGGEVTLRPDFCDLVRHASGKGLRVVVQTNGRALAHPDLCARLTGISDLLFVVALHSWSPEVHDRITLRRGSHEQTTTAIRQLRSAGYPVVAKVVLSNLNLGQTRRTAGLARDLGVTEFCVAFPHALDFPDDRFRSVVPRYRQLGEDLRTACEYAVRCDFPMTFETIPYCVARDLPALWQRSCDLHSRAASPGASARAAWANATFDWEELRPVMKQKEPRCSACVFDRVCEGPWREYVAAFGFEEFRPLGAADVAAFLASVEGPRPATPAPEAP